MSVIYIVLPIAIILASAAVGAFIWCARCGQLDDLDGPPIRAVHDDDDLHVSRPTAGSSSRTADPECRS